LAKNITGPGFKQALAYLPNGPEPLHYCWVQLDSGVIAACMVGRTKSEDMGNNCHDIHKSYYMDTKSLPRAANFDGGGK